MSSPEDIQAHVPQLGHKLKGIGVEVILQAIVGRQQNFPDEDLMTMTIPFVLMNIGHTFDPMICVEEEWRGRRKDCARDPETKKPVCPNGHEVMTAGRGMSLGWVTNHG